MPGVKGSGGPMPKRADQRRRRNKPAIPVTKAVADGRVRGPELSGRHSAVGRRFYESLRTSGQSAFYQPSDWAFAEIVVVAIDAFARQPSASMLASILKCASGLLATEADRRRVRLELEQAKADDGGEAAVAWLDDARRRIKDEAQAPA